MRVVFVTRFSKQLVPVTTPAVACRFRPRRLSLPLAASASPRLAASASPLFALRICIDRLIAKMVQRKERTLLVDVQSLDAEPSPPAAAALFAELRAALERAGGDPSKVATRNYSREARICAVRTPLALSRMARTAIGTVKYVKGRCACCCGMHCERARAAFFC